jgi:predicted AAA+ superfamily ATPase
MIEYPFSEPKLLMPPTPEFSPANAFDLPFFTETLHTHRVLDLCSALQQTRTLGLLVGLPGVGKTWAVQNAAQKQHQPPLILASPVLYTSVDVENTSRTLLTNILNCLGPDYRAPIPDMISMACCWIHRREVALIILDEAERLDKASLSVIQDIHERTRCAFLFVGDVDFVIRVRKYPSIYNRIGTTLEIPPLGFDEMERFLETWLEVRSKKQNYICHGAELFPVRHDIPEDFVLLKEIYRTTLGNLRRIILVVQNSERIADINGQRFVQMATIQAAAKLLNGVA